MVALTDRQRIELAIPAYLLYVVTGAPGVFVSPDPELTSHVDAEVVLLRDDLRSAALEPFADLAQNKRRALIRRLERVSRRAIADWSDHPALSLMLRLWCFLEDLVDRGVLILWEGSAMDRAMDRLMPMCRHGFEDPECVLDSQKQARLMLSRLQAEGLFL